MSDRVLVIGSNGFVGSAIFRRVLDQNVEELVKATRTLSGMTGVGGSDCIGIDITNPEMIDSAIREVRPQVVINAASYGVNPDETDFKAALEVNVNGPIRLLNAAASIGCRRFIQLGTCSEYGSVEGVVSEETRAYPQSTYGVTKFAATTLLCQYSLELDVDVVVLRLFNIWGEWEKPHRLFPSLMKARELRSTVELTEGSQLKDYSYVGDVADTIIEIARLEGKLGWNIVNVGSGSSRPLREFVVDLAKTLDVEHLLRFGAKPRRGNEPLGQVPDLGRLNCILPKRQQTSLAEAVQSVIGSRPT